MISLNKLLKIISILISVLSYKSLPLSYCFQFYNIGFKNLVWNKPLVVKDDLELLKPELYKTHCSLLECDFYLHKSNSTYFSDLDLARTDLLLRKLYLFFWKVKKESGSFPMLPVGSVVCHFKKEIKPFAKYDIFSSIFAWDDRWVFMLSKFMIGDKLHALALTRSVFKTGRKTWKPAEMFEACGLYNDQVAKINEKRLPLVERYIQESNLLNSIDDIYTTRPKL